MAEAAGLDTFPKLLRHHSRQRGATAWAMRSPMEIRHYCPSPVLARILTVHKEIGSWHPGRQLPVRIRA